MRLAFLHFDLCGGPWEKNRDNLLRGIGAAAAQGADWVLTPEMALQGYHMATGGAPYTLAADDSEALRPFRQAARDYGVVIFFSCGSTEKDIPHNSCLIINRAGDIIGRHHKIKVLAWPTENWAVAGDTAENLRPVTVDGVKTGLLICADAYFDEYGAGLGKHEPDLVVLPVAWPPHGCGGPPENAWRRCSIASGAPVVVVNQTGHSGMDCREAESAIVFGTDVVCTYAGPEAILLYDYKVGGSLPEMFNVCPWRGAPQPKERTS